MNIVGILVQSARGRAEDIRNALAEWTGVEVHAATPSGQLVVTVDVEQADQGAEALVAIHNLPGVLAASLVYQHSEPDSVPTEVPR